jgi:acyl-coenzyme A thioesterase PaaI-like protein
MRGITRIQTAGLSLAGWLLFGGVSAQAVDQAAAGASTTVAVEGVQVAIDPATGRLREPTAAERAALSKALIERAVQSRSNQLSASGTDFVRPLTEQDARATTRKLRLRNGVEVTGMDLPESLVSSLVAEKQADGSLHIHHQGEPAGDAKSKQEVTR